MKAKYKRITANFFSLSVLQGMNYILPLITLPYLVQVLGVEKFGLVSFASAFALYFGIIADYGYKLTAPRDIAKCDNNVKEINRIANVVFSSKAIILIILFLMLLVIVSNVSPFKEHKLVYLSAFFAIACQSFMPVWFFQGMEEMKYITYINILAKIMFIILVFSCISGPEDYYYVPLFTAIGFFIATVLSIYQIKKKYSYSFKLPYVSEIREAFKDGWEIFLGSSFTSLYTNSNIVMLGLFTSPVIVGYFTIADKIVSAISGLFIPLNQAIYPFLSKQYSTSKIKFYDIFLKLQKYLFLFSLIFLLIFFGLKEPIIKFVTNEINLIVLLLISIMSLRIVSSPFSNLYSNVLIIAGRKAQYLKVMKLTVYANIILVFPATYIYESIGLAVGFVTVLWLHTAMLYIQTTKIDYEKP